jgi:hypothetical protein
MDAIFGPIGLLGPCAVIPMTEASSFINFPINVCVAPIIKVDPPTIGVPSSNGSNNGNQLSP